MGAENRDELLLESSLLHQDQLDAGALFVLKAKGSWLHCGYHLTASIVGPPLLSLPYALSLLGWAGGVSCLLVGALVTFYSYNLLSLVLEHQAERGHRHLRYRDMANDILGLRWSRYFVAPLQFVLCICAVVGCILPGGECFKMELQKVGVSQGLLSASLESGISSATTSLSLETWITCSLLWEEWEVKLYECTMVYGGVILILAQLPSFHSLRYINLLSLIASLFYSACTIAALVVVGNLSKGEKDYSLSDNTEDRVMGYFSSIGIIATTYGNGIIPEIQATLAPPVKGKMLKGLCVCYAVVMVTFFGMGISGYRTFGNQVNSFVVTSLVDDSNALLLKWLILIIVFLVIIQTSAVAGVYLQPTNEALERVFSDPSSAQFSARNITTRVISRSLSVAASTFVAMMLPFFGDISSLMGALGFLPLDFVLPMVFYNLTFRPSKRNPLFWLNSSIAVVFSLVAVIAVFAAVRAIVLDAKDYHLFS